MWRLFSTPPSINKQFLLSCHLYGLCSFLWAFLLSVISCYIRHIHFSHLIIPSRLTPCPTTVISSTPTNSPLQVYHLPLNCHTCYFFLLSSLPLSAAWCSASQMDMQFWVRACAVQNIKSEAQPDVPSSTESVYLGVTTMPSAAGCVCSPHLVPRSRLIVLTTAASQCESGNYILLCVIPIRTP